ncbi:MAG TPA: sulfite exporter TauE/SafE family protein, partial [Gemmatimonadaceae bacterium]
MEFFWLTLLGLAIGAFGTLIGAGGGFLLVPILLLMYPRDNPATITSISLAVVFLNAASGSVAYLRQHRVDVRSALRFSASAIPGSVLGALAVS